MGSKIKFLEYPRTEAPSKLTTEVIEVFRDVEDQISSIKLEKESLTSQRAQKILRPGLEDLGFYVEGGNYNGDPLKRPVIFGENGEAASTYEVDGYHPEAECIIEIEAGRGAQSNAVHRDIIRAMTISGVALLLLAVPNLYKRDSTRAEAFNQAKPLIERLYRSNRVDLPFRLGLIGY